MCHLRTLSSSPTVPTVTMSGPSGHFPDAFLNENYNISYPNNPHISHTDRNVLNLVPEVSLQFFPKTLLY